MYLCERFSGQCSVVHRSDFMTSRTKDDFEVTILTTPFANCFVTYSARNFFLLLNLQNNV